MDDADNDAENDAEKLGRESALATMNRSLRAQFEAAQRALAAVARHEIRHRYELGRVVLRLTRDEARYGDRAVERLAEALGVGFKTLYRHGKVAELWSPAELRAFQGLRDAMGQPLGWSHLVALTDRDAERDAWIEKTLAGSWSARRLVKEMELATAPEVTTDVAVETSTRSAMLQTISHALHWNTNLRGTTDALLDRLADLSTWTPEIRELWEKLLRAFDESQRRTVEVVTRLKRVGEDVGRPARTSGFRLGSAAAAAAAAGSGAPRAPGAQEIVSADKIGLGPRPVPGATPRRRTR